MLKNFQLFLEKQEYDINLANGVTDYNFIGKNKGRFNRLQHLVYQIEQSGSPLEGEKISEILLGATNLNTLNLSYPFVDLKVITPVKGVTQNNELISVKTSRDKNTLEEAVTYVNGFKISQLIQFAISKINLKIFKSEVFKDRFAIKLSSITSYYQKTIIRLFSDNTTIYTYAFVNEIIILNFIKDYFNYLSGIEHIIEKNRNKLYSIISACIAGFIDKKFDTNYTDSIKVSNELKNRVQMFLSIPNKNYDFTSVSKGDINYGEALPAEIRNLKISYCILYFSDFEEGTVLNLQKTHAVNFSDLFDKSMKIWIRKGYHKPEDIKKNFYLNYQGVIEAFSTDDNAEVFDTHIKVQINADYTEREESIKKLYVKVIDNIKGIENDESQVKILKLLNKYLNKINTKNKVTRDRYIQKFSEIFNKEIT